MDIKRTYSNGAVRKYDVVSVHQSPEDGDTLQLITNCSGMVLIKKQDEPRFFAKIMSSGLEVNTQPAMIDSAQALTQKDLLSLMPDTRLLLLDDPEAVEQVRQIKMLLGAKVNSAWWLLMRPANSELLKLTASLNSGWPCAINGWSLEGDINTLVWSADCQTPKPSVEAIAQYWSANLAN